MESSIRMAWNEIRHRGNLVRDFSEVPRIAGNENRLGQVFLNLLVNAAQALPDERTTKSQISASIRAHDRDVLIEVSDTGCGIPAERLGQVFEPFFTTKAPGVGSGLGLSICRSIVSDLGGEISVQSRVGEGTTFRIRLPALDVAFSTRPPQLETVAAQRCRILALDDEAALCHVIRRLLASEHEVHVEVDARRALELLARDSNFDVIFCDVMMPAMSGIEFYAALPQVAPDLVSRTVFLTGGTFNAQARQFLNAPKRRVIEKPFERAALRRVIAEVLEAHPRSGTFATRDVQRAM